MTLFDIVNSDEIIFNIRMVSGDTRLFGHPLNLSAYQAQGKMESRPGDGTVTVSKDGNRLNEWIYRPILTPPNRLHNVLI